MRDFLLAQFERSDLKCGSRLPGVRQVATHLKVSIPTVHRVFQELAQEGRLRTEVGNGTYLVNKHARKAQTLTFALSLPTPSRQVAQDWASRIYGGILQGASQAAPAITLRPVPHQADKVEEAIRELLIQRSQVDGLILFPSSFGERIRREYEQDGKPVIAMNPPSETAVANFVSSDYYGASTCLAKAWQTSGRRHIALLLGEPLEQSVSCRLRLAGLTNGLGAAAGRTVDYRVVVADDTAESDGYEAMRALLAESDWIPDAVCCAGDRLAMGVLRALRERGLRVPRDASVSGGTGFDLSDTASPELTRTKQPLEALGQELVAMLAQRIEQDGVDLPARILPSPWIGGATTRPEENALLGIAMTRRELSGREAA